MTNNPALRRLLDLPGIAELEEKALMKPRYADDDARSEFPEIDACSTEIFGLTADEADELPRPEGWDRIERKPVREQVDAFEAEGWDITDAKRAARCACGDTSTSSSGWPSAAWPARCHSMPRRSRTTSRPPWRGTPRSSCATGARAGR